MDHTTYEDGTEFSETLAHKIHTPGNHKKKKKKRMHHSKHGECLKSGKLFIFDYTKVTWNADLTHVPEVIK
jgi:hypothetical protein